jgi:hypothetical protein
MLFSCQDEEEHTVLNNENSFSKAAPLSSLIERVSQYETTADNVLDGTSNCSIKLPVHLTVDGQYVYVDSEADFQSVQNIKNQSSTDDDKVHFSFPITIVYPSFYEHVVTSEPQFDSILANYGDDSSYRDITCVDFNYPISINIYNSENQVANSIALQNDSQLYNFVDELNDGDIVGIVFPIRLTKSNGQDIVITNNTQLEAAIENAIEDCVVSVPNPSALYDTLTNGSWYVSYFYGDGHDETDYYNGYNFTFNPNGTSVAIKASTTVNGQWDIHDESTYKRLDLNFDGSILEELNEDWKVLEYTSTSVRLKHESGGGSDNHYLNFTKN